MGLPKKVVDIQEKREQEALKIFIDKRQLYDQLKKEHDEKIEELNAFKAWRKEETNRVFLELQANPLPKKELDKKKQALAEFKFKELAMIEEEMKIAENVKNAEKIKEKAQQDYNSTRIKKTKFEEVYTTQKRLELMHLDRKEESDLDEEQVLKFVNDHL
jgi:hypothetical protein